VPQDPKKPNRAYPESRLQKEYMKTYSYLKGFEKELRNRSGWKQILSKKESEFYGIMDVGTYTFAPWKVVWPWISKDIRASVVGFINQKPLIPEHNIFFVACKIKQEAFYIAAIMNSSPFNFAARSLFSTGGGGIGSASVLEHIRIPLYNSFNKVHERLANLSEAAHKAVKERNEMLLRQIEADIDQAAAELWGLTDDELKVIQQSLAELEGEEVAV
jgi:hypothetical protein